MKVSCFIAPCSSVHVTNLFSKKMRAEKARIYYIKIMIFENCRLKHRCYFFSSFFFTSTGL